MGYGRIYLNDGWQFTRQYGQQLHDPAMDTAAMERVRLPHTTVETPFHYFDESEYQYESAYRRVLRPETDWRGKHVLLTVEAAGHESEIYLNGVSLAVHRCGYTAYTVDLAPYLHWDGDNILVIRVDSRETLNQPPFGNVIDYMTYGGLYREVYLEIKEDPYISDVFPRVTELITQDGVTGNVKLESSVVVENGGETTLRQEILDGEGKVITSGEKVHVLSDARLWAPEHPVLYTLRTILLRGKQVLDMREDRIGLRTVEFQTDGFYLNGRKYKIRGLNRHQSYPYVGYAMPASMQRHDAEILKKELGLNAVRTSHYPQSRHFFDACDELGLLVFTEIPGWQHIGNEEWKKQAVRNTQDMVLQYRNHPSVFLWGVRINESMDDDAFYRETNAAAHALDNSRPTSGVRFFQKSSLLEDVYAYNDFSHDGTNGGVMKKGRVTPNGKKGYLISEYNGHMFPTKSFDNEDHRVEHMLRHACVMNGYYGEDDIAGGFGWCMADYNTHKDFGSGDRICYHGVLDMFRNHKLAAAVYASQQDATQDEEVILEISSSMDIGEHPACLMKDVYAVTNADTVRMYKNDQFIGAYDCGTSPFRNLPHGPVLIDDFVGNLLEKNEGFSHGKAEDIKKILQAANKYGLAHLPPHILLLAAKCMLLRGMKMSDAVALYNKYMGNWGGTVTTYRFEAVVNGKVVRTVEKRPVKQMKLDVKVSHTELVEGTTYDVSAVRIRALSQDGAVLPYYQEPLRLSVNGPVELIGPDVLSLRGGMCGTFVKTTGETGDAVLTIACRETEPVEIRFRVIRK